MKDLRYIKLLEEYLLQKFCFKLSFKSSRNQVTEMNVEVLENKMFSWN